MADKIGGPPGGPGEHDEFTPASERQPPGSHHAIPPREPLIRRKTRFYEDSVFRARARRGGKWAGIVALLLLAVWLVPKGVNRGAEWLANREDRKEEAKRQNDAAIAATRAYNDSVAKAARDRAFAARQAEMYAHWDTLEAEIESGAELGVTSRRITRIRDLARSDPVMRKSVDSVAAELAQASPDRRAIAGRIHTQRGHEDHVRVAGTGGNKTPPPAAGSPPRRAPARQPARTVASSLQRDRYQRNPAYPWPKAQILGTIVRKDIWMIYPRYVLTLGPDRLMYYKFDSQLEGTAEMPDIVVVCDTSRTPTAGYLHCGDGRGLAASTARFEHIGNGVWRSPKGLPTLRTGALMLHLPSGEWRPSQWAQWTHNFIGVLPDAFPYVATIPLVRMFEKEGTRGRPEFQQVLAQGAADQYGVTPMDVGIDLCYMRLPDGTYARDPMCGICITMLHGAVNGFAILPLPQPALQAPPYNGQYCPEPPAAKWFTEGFLPVIRQINVYDYFSGGTQ